MLEMLLDKWREKTSKIEGMVLERQVSFELHQVKLRSLRANRETWVVNLISILMAEIGLIWRTDYAEQLDHLWN